MKLMAVMCHIVALILLGCKQRTTESSEKKIDFVTPTPPSGTYVTDNKRPVTNRAGGKQDLPFQEFIVHIEDFKNARQSVASCSIQVHPTPGASGMHLPFTGCSSDIDSISGKQKICVLVPVVGDVARTLKIPANSTANGYFAIVLDGGDQFSPPSKYATLYKLKGETAAKDCLDKIRKLSIFSEVYGPDFVLAKH